MAHAAGESIPGSKLSHIPENAMRMLVSIRKSDFFFFFGLFRAAPTAYGSSQARGPIRAVAASLHHRHNNARSEPHLQPTPQLKATLDS